ncbi:MAG: FAD-dependent monooxygenase, partial [Aestuariivirgaceae bacterium]
QVKAVQVEMQGQLREIRSVLTVAADGRESLLRRRARLPVQDLGAPIDVLWFRLSRRPGDPEETMGRFEAGRIIVMLNRGSYWQCAFVISKGGIEETRAAGLAAFRDTIAGLLGFSPDRTSEIRSWDDVKLLTVKVDRLKSWCKPGLLCIGDAAHAMSPVGGVGINLAVQDAVAAANILAFPLAHGTVDLDTLRRVQKRRGWPTRVTQRLQLVIQNNVIAPTLQSRKFERPPLVARMLTSWPLLRRIPARLLALGVRPEHVSEEIRTSSGQMAGVR